MTTADQPALPLQFSENDTATLKSQDRYRNPLCNDCGQL